MSSPPSSGRSLAGRRTNSTVDQIVERLRAGIRSGDLVPGQRIVQEDLVADLKVSRGPVREALRRLAADGLVELKFNSGASVRLFSRAEVIALEEAREAIEGAAAALAARRLRASGRSKELELLCESMSAAAAEHAQRTFLALNEQFHHLILTVAGNPVLQQFAGQLHTQMIQHQFGGFDGIDWMPLAQAEHLSIARAILQEDPGEAEAAMRRHLQRVRSISEALPGDFYRPARASK